MKYRLEDLLAIQRTCIGAAGGDPRDTKRWVEELEIDTDDWAAFADKVGDAGVLLSHITGASPGRAFAAMFSAGFEFGVRFQEQRQVVV